MGKAAELANRLLNPDEKVAYAYMGKDTGETNKLIVITDRRLIVAGSSLGSTETTVLERSNVLGVQPTADKRVVLRTPAGELAVCAVLPKQFPDMVAAIRGFPSTPRRTVGGMNAELSKRDLVRVI